jgi:hypothetical protein
VTRKPRPYPRNFRHFFSVSSGWHGCDGVRDGGRGLVYSVWRVGRCGNLNPDSTFVGLPPQWAAFARNARGPVRIRSWRVRWRGGKRTTRASGKRGAKLRPQTVRGQHQQTAGANVIRACGSAKPELPQVASGSGAYLASRFMSIPAGSLFFSSSRSPWANNSRCSIRIGPRSSIGRWASSPAFYFLPQSYFMS